MTWRACLALVAGTMGSAHAGYAALHHGTARAYPAGYWIGTACIVAAFGLVLCMVGKRKEGK